MRLNPADSIRGVPVLRLRDALRASGLHFTAREIGDRLRIPSDEIGPLIAELVARGYIEPDSTYGGEQIWRPSAAGAQFASAPGTRPITRATADRLLRGLLERAQKVNRSSEFLYKVTKIGVFGSYLRDTNDLGDVDVAVKLTPKVSDREQHFRACQKRTAQAAAQGRSFHNFVDRLAWPEEEVYRFLRNRKRSLALVRFDNPALEGADVRILLDEP